MKQTRRLTLTGSQLKLLACLTMLADHAAKGFQLHGLSFLVLSDLLGRITFPVFCMMLAEGFFHTHSRTRYILRMLAIALISELPFDLLFSGQLCDWSSQNTCFTLTLGLLLFSVLQTIRQADGLSWRIALLAQACTLFLFAAAAAWLRVDYGMNGIAALAACYYGCCPSRFPDVETKKRSTAALAACFLLNLIQFQNAGAFLALIPLSRYNGQRGFATAHTKYLFYLFYPIHLLLLAFASHGL